MGVTGEWVVDIELETNAENGTVQAKTINTPAVKENYCFSFPSTSPETIKMHSQEVEEEMPRKSIKVIEKKSKCLGVELGATPRQEEIKFSATSHGDNYFEIESDASSDLFEIESLRGKGKGNPFLARQDSDAASSCVTPIAYAPREASIEWSAVTASAADF